MDSRGECYNLGILLAGVEPRSISHHVTMHFVQLLDNFRMERDVLHDPLTLELVNKKQELLSGRRFQRSKQIRGETLVSA